MTSSTLDDLLAALDSEDGGAGQVTSVRLPAGLREALRHAVALGLESTANAATVTAVRARLEAFAARLALEEHYARHPSARPTLSELTQAEAELTHHPLADSPALLAEVAREVAQISPDATPEAVLLVAGIDAARGRATAPARRRRAS